MSVRLACVSRHFTCRPVGAWHAALALGLLGACNDPPPVTAPSTAPALAAAAAQGAPAVTWLAPLGTGVADPSTFDGAAAPVVEVCAWTGGACAGAPVARFTTVPTLGASLLSVNASAGAYEAAWSLNDARFTTRRTYRVRVLRGEAELGAVSVDVVRGRWAPARGDGTLAPLAAAATVPVRFHLTTAATSGALRFRGAPVLSRQVTRVGVPAGVIVGVGVEAGPDVVVGGVQLFEVGTAGTDVRGTALRDDGGDASGDQVAGDGVYSGRLTVDATSARTIRYGALATGTLRSAALEARSPTAAFVVGHGRGDEDPTQIKRFQEAVLLQLNGRRLTSIPALLDELAEVVRVDPIVAAADVVSDQELRILYKSGRVGGILLPTAGGQGMAPAPGGAARPAQALDPDPRRISPLAPSTPGTFDPAKRVESNTVLVYAPFHTEAGAYAVGNRVLDLAKASPVGLRGTLLADAAATVKAVDEFPKYGLVFIHTHGVVGGFFTGEAVTAPKSLEYKDALDRGALAEKSVPDADWIGELISIVSPRTHYVVTDVRIRELGRFPKSIVVGAHCWSAVDNTLAAAFTDKGAQAYFGYTKRVSFGHMFNALPPFLKPLLDGEKTAGDAYGAYTPKVDPVEGAAFAADGEAGAHFSPDPRPAPAPPVPTPSGGLGSSFDDPHLMTPDGLTYDFMAVGDYVLSESTEPGDDFAVHARYRRMEAHPWVSLNAGFAARVAGDVVNLFPVALDGFDLVINGEEVAGAYTFSRRLPGGGTIEVGDGEAKVSWPDRTLLTARRWGVQLLLAPGRRGKVRGLLGNYDGDAANDLAVKGGRVLASELARTDTIYREFRQSWRVALDGNASLFRRGPDPWEPAPPRAVPRDPDVFVRARAYCAAQGVVHPDVLDACAFDLMATGDESWAQVAVRFDPAIVTLHLTPALSYLALGESLPFTAAVTGTTNRGVTWTVSGGTVRATSGFGMTYTAPATAGDYTITARSNADGRVVETSRVVVGRPPVVTIEAPTSGEVMRERTDAPWYGSARDAEGKRVPETSFVWTSSVDGRIGDGASVSPRSLSLGRHVITLTAVDRRGIAGSATVHVVVERTPAVSISAPADGATFRYGDPVTLQGSASDREDGPLSGPSLTWHEVDRSGNSRRQLGTGASVTVRNLAPGQRTVRLLAQDSRGWYGVAGVTLTILGPPGATIASPADGATFRQGEPILFSGSVNELEAPHRPLRPVWILSSGLSQFELLGFTWRGLPPGTYVVTLGAADLRNWPGTATARFVVTAATRAAAAARPAPSRDPRRAEPP